MKRLSATVALTGLLVLSGCASGPETSRERYERLLPPKADPGTVVATEIAFAQAAREKGQWTAFRKFAAPDALIFGRHGAIPAEPWLKAQEDPARPVTWEPYQVWSSCDGSTAVTRGAFVDPNDDTRGEFYTVWERQKDRSYAWAFDFGYALDRPLDKPDAIATDIASCKAGEAAQNTADGALRTSADGSLQWSFRFTGERKREFHVWLRRDDGATQVVNVRDR